MSFLNKMILEEIEFKKNRKSAKEAIERALGDQVLLYDAHINWVHGFISRDPEGRDLPLPCALSLRRRGLTVLEQCLQDCSHSERSPNRLCLLPQHFLGCGTE